MPLSPDKRVIRVTGHAFFWLHVYPDKEMFTKKGYWLITESPLVIGVTNTEAEFDPLYTFWVRYETNLKDKQAFRVVETLKGRYVYSDTEGKIFKAVFENCFPLI